MSHEHVRQLKLIRDEYDVAKAALLYLREGWNQLHIDKRLDGISLLQVQSTVRQLETTYLIRLFAEFESVLRRYWMTSRRRALLPRMQMELLVNRVALHVHVPNDIRDATHDVRTFRNSLVHAGDSNAINLTFEQAISSLSEFVAVLTDI